MSRSMLLVFFVVLLLSGQQSGAVTLQGLPDFSELAERSSPAVVKIQTEIAAKKHAMSPDYDQELPEIFRHFFGGDPRLFQQQPYQFDQPPRQGMGSGFIVAADGYILTNNHVVDGADKIVVTLNEGDEYPAKLVGTDPRSDLALLKIDVKDKILPVVTFTKDVVKPGQWVLAIGSPFGLDYSVSVGVVSAIGRSLPTENNENYIPFIQTDVAINPGNSGGPLLNLNGEVVGINSQIFTRSGGYMGLSFAIPADLAVSVVKQLREKGYVSRGWLGVSIQDIDRNLANSFGLDKPRGALVAQLVNGSPSEGVLQAGDIILEFNGMEIRKSGDLPHAVGATPAGTVSTLKILRDHKEKTVSLKLGELPEDPGKLTAAKPGQPATDNVLGLVVENIDSQTQKELSIPGGVVVRQVVPDSPADVTGLIPGDIITQLGFIAINSEADFKKQSAALEKGSPQPIRFFRRGQPVFRTILIDK